MAGEGVPQGVRHVKPGPRLVTDQERGADLVSPSPSDWTKEKTDSKSYLVEPHRQPRRKMRRRPMTMREMGIDVACEGGMFVVPPEAYRSMPMVVALCEFSVMLYNKVADLKAHKAAVDAKMAGATGKKLVSLKKESTGAKVLITALRRQLNVYRKFIVNVEGGTPINEPLTWDRE